MEYLIKDLIVKLSDRKKVEMNIIETYKKEKLKDLILISSGKIIELDHLISDLKEMLKYNSKVKYFRNENTDMDCN
jgi:L-serine deaminase